MPQLKECFQAAGFEDVRTLLSSGNVAFTTRDSSWTALERQAEQAMLASLGHAFPTIIRTTEYLQHLVGSDPFAEFPGGKYEMASLELHEGATIDPSTVRRPTVEAVALNETRGNPTLVAKRT
jgi:uncharacterized protein (DUF1697 family)